MKHPLPPLLLAALAASASAQDGPKPSPDLPPFRPDVKSPWSTPDPESVERVLDAARTEAAIPALARPAKPADALDASAASAIDFSRLYFDEPGDGRLWARARTYKASFDAAAATFIPFLGSEAPRNFPVRVELLEAVVGTTSIELEARDVTRAGHAVTIDRGPIREVWHLGLDSAEQTFELAGRPSAAGALRLVLALESELEPRPDGPGFVLDGPHGGVRIGGATAVDADGRRLELESRIEAGTIQIEVPEVFVRAARFPLVVDPVYSTNALDGFTNECALPDIANRGTSGDFAAVFQFAYSATDADVFAVDLYYGIPVAGSGTWVDSTAVSWGVPRTAYNALSDTLLTVAQVKPTPSSQSEIWCRARQAGTSSQYAQKPIQNAALGSCFYPDVGGDPALSGPTYFLAAWTRAFTANDWDVHARLIDGQGNSVGGTIFLENSGASDWRPSVSKTNGRPPYATQNWNVVWMRDTTPTNLDVLGAQVRWDGAVTNPATVLAGSVWNESYPSASSPLDAASGPRPWMVAFQRFVISSDIVTLVCEGTTVLADANLSALEGAYISEQQIQPDVDSNGQRFVVAYSESYNGSSTDRDAYYATIAWAENGLRVDEAHVNIDYSGRDTYGIQIACGVNQANYGFAFYGLAWPRYGSGNGDVFSGSCYEPTTVEGFCAGDGSAGACPCGNTGASGRGCANSATDGAGIYPSGQAWVMADSFGLQAFNLPGSTTCLFFQGTSSSPAGVPFGDGLRCVAGTVTRIAAKTAASGIATYPEPGDLPISVKGLVPAVGAERAYQVWYRNAAAFCTPSTFNVSSGIRVRWLR
ncbi:MAG: hypothetical protein JNK02_03260 [Planctomycetes bacterium]|nr:hypothetical protein [Planctomycetota bacterium]